MLARSMSRSSGRMRHADDRGRGRDGPGDPGARSPPIIRLRGRPPDSGPTKAILTAAPIGPKSPQNIPRSGAFHSFVFRREVINKNRRQVLLQEFPRDSCSLSFQQYRLQQWVFVSHFLSASINAVGASADAPAAPIKSGAPSSVQVFLYRMALDLVVQIRPRFANCETVATHLPAVVDARTPGHRGRGQTG